MPVCTFADPRSGGAEKQKTGQLTGVASIADPVLIDQSPTVRSIDDEVAKDDMEILGVESLRKGEFSTRAIYAPGVTLRGSMEVERGQLTAQSRICAMRRGKSTVNGTGSFWPACSGTRACSASEPTCDSPT
jgi:hypothetical protein